MRSPTSPPPWIKPELAALVKAAPDGANWLHEIKLDGYRMHARLDAGRVQLLTRRCNDWTAKYPSIVEAIARLPAKNAYLDGELCGVLPDGNGSPLVLSRVHWVRPEMVVEVSYVEVDPWRIAEARGLPG